MERANYICQRCHKAPATEVHHLTYARVFNELATDLLPVCSTCHRNIHRLRPATTSSNSSYRSRSRTTVDPLRSPVPPRIRVQVAADPAGRTEMPTARLM
jgi:protein-arginine kinase activator protein McsA